MFRNAPRASGYFRTGYAQDLALIQTRLEGAALAALALALALFPFFAGAFYLDLACQVFLAAIGALSLMLLTGYAGQISLGHAGLLAAGAFTVGILFREVRAPFWLTLPAAALVGAVLGVIFGLPSLRLRGLYLAVSTLALYFVVAYLGGEYESRRGFSTGIMIDAPSIGGFALKNARGWYFVLLAAAAATLLICANLLRSRTGRAWRAIRAHETVAEALGIGIASYKLLAFVISSALASLAGALFAYYRGFVSVEAFSLFLSIQYVAMIIIGGMGSLLGALLGALFVTLLPYLIEALLMRLPHAQSYAGSLFAIDYSAFGVVMILFLVFEPLGLVGIWRRLQNYFLLWPFKYRPVAGDAPMNEAPLLRVDKLEVVYHRTITAVQGDQPRRRGRTDRRRPRHQRRRQVHDPAGDFRLPRHRRRPRHRRQRDLQGTADREPAAQRDRAPGRRSGARARQGVSEPHGGRESGRAVRAVGAWTKRQRGVRLSCIPAPRRSAPPDRRSPFRRRAADAGARAARSSAARSCSWSMNCRLASPPPSSKN